MLTYSTWGYFIHLVRLFGLWINQVSQVSLCSLCSLCIRSKSNKSGRSCLGGERRSNERNPAPHDFIDRSVQNGGQKNAIQRRSEFRRHVTPRTNHTYGFWFLHAVVKPLKLSTGGWGAPCSSECTTPRLRPPKKCCSAPALDANLERVLCWGGVSPCPCTPLTCCTPCPRAP